jgi:hypothetical protein
MDQKILSRLLRNPERTLQFAALGNMAGGMLFAFEKGNNREAQSEWD